MKKSVLYLGDGSARGAARHLLGILKHAGYRALHLPPDEKVKARIFKNTFSIIIVSDYARCYLSREAMRAIERQVLKGTGFLMIGGWSSFTGLNGRYRGSLIERMLPVACLAKDDRRNLASGAWISARDPRHLILKGMNLKPSPVIVGYNEVRPKPGAQTLLDLVENVSKGRKPLLVIGRYGKAKTAAFTTDIAPHWCGGLLDWGRKRLKLKAGKGIEIEVGDFYIRFFTQLLKWLENSHRSLVTSHK